MSAKVKNYFFPNPWELELWMQCQLCWDLLIWNLQRRREMGATCLSDPQDMMLEEAMVIHIPLSDKLQVVGMVLWVTIAALSWHLGGGGYGEPST